MELSVKDITVAIEKKVILRDVSLTFPAGKRTAIIGPNGAGKSTLLKTISGSMKPSAGQVLLDGEDVRTMKRKRIARKLAILPQGMTAPPDTTVEQLVDYGRFPYRGLLGAEDAKADREAVAWAIDATHLAPLCEQQVITLSGGERQRAFLAMALAQQPEILLLDEPTTYLDIAHQLEVMNIITEINRRYGMTIIMVLHDINHALQYADEIVVIKDHGIYGQGSPQDLMTVQTVADVYGVRADFFTNSQGVTVLSPIELVRRR